MRITVLFLLITSLAAHATPNQLIKKNKSIEQSGKIDIDNWLENVIKEKSENKNHNHILDKKEPEDTVTPKTSKRFKNYSPIVARKLRDNRPEYTVDFVDQETENRINRQACGLTVAWLAISATVIGSYLWEYITG